MAQNWYLQNDMYYNGDETSALLAEAIDVFDEMVQYGGESYDIEIDGTSTRGIVQEIYSNGVSPNEKKLLTKLDDPLYVGSIITWDNFEWMILDTPDNSNQVHYTSKIRRCNLTPFYFKVNNATQTVNGYYEKNIYTNPDGNQINLPNDIIMVTLPKTTNTSKIKKNSIFYIWDDDGYECYEVEGIDKSKKDGSHGLIIIKAKESQSDITPQEYYSLEPISSTSIGSVVVTPSTLSMTVNTTKQLNVALYDKSGILMPDETVTWSSSSNSIATVVNGLVTALTVGSVEIIASSVTDASIVGKCVLSVIQDEGWF